MSKIQVPTKKYVDGFGHPIGIICNANTKTIVIDFYRTGKYTALLLWTYNNEACIYSLTIINNGTTLESVVELFTVFKGPISGDRTVEPYVVEASNEKISIGLTTNIGFWDVATVIAPCKTSGHAHD